ncbi:YbjN domain-containing protein [Pseudoxanthomonas daejeonensis]|uniref:YbjN domain-containing protein n=1 Tax=Pseudoxanthomonas daejeonensis TaxID=266062 RepID=UPI001F54196B|nr:YbjN domain-containing protein [Pseudoxanthomonas daejeonensis]UNK57317.1 YbjN domain-containing protein [Pseudoxanthomonas daejeonensis]
MSLRRLAVLLLLVLLPLSALAAPKADPSVAAMLDELGYKYEVDGDGDYKMIMALEGKDNAERSQLVFVRSPVETYGTHRIREIWSPAYKSSGAFPGPVANRLLEASNDLKLGAWVKHNGHALLVVKLDAAAGAEALDQAINAAVTSADEMERELAGDPDSDEF